MENYLRDKLESPFLHQSMIDEDEEGEHVIWLGMMYLEQKLIQV